MAEQAPELATQLEALVGEVRDLRRRLETVERALAGRAAIPEAPPAAPELEPRIAPAILAPREEPSAERALEATAGALPLVGRALLGLAGAYLLRALTEYGALPRAIGVAAGIVYAMAWLVVAARAPAGARLEVAIHGMTAALVLGPLLVETTLQLKAVQPAAAAALLALFSIFGLLVSWRKNLAGVAWITTLAALATSLVLLVGTHDVAPFTLGVLLVAAAVEASALRDHWLSERWIVAASADLCVVLLIWLITRPGGLPESYAPIPTVAALAALGMLLVVYVGSTVGRTLVRGLAITPFETAQTVVAFAISLWGALRIAASQPGVAAMVGAGAVLCGAACYLVSFAFLERKPAAARNLYTYSTFGFLLLAAGSRLLLAGQALALLWAAIAVACAWIGIRSKRNTLCMHGAMYLAAASLASGLALGSGIHLFQPGAGSAPEFGALATAVAAAVATVLSFLEPDEGARRLPVLLIAGIAVWAWAGLASWALAASSHSIGSPSAAAGLAPTLATVVLSAMAVALAWAGRRWGGAELTWLVPPVLLLAGYKLVTQDLRKSQTLALFISLLSYGIVLVWMPRILRARPTMKPRAR
jgi:hypothetical protein